MTQDFAICPIIQKLDKILSYFIMSDLHDPCSDPLTIIHFLQIHFFIPPSLYHPLGSFFFPYLGMKLL